MVKDSLQEGRWSLPTKYGTDANSGWQMQTCMPAAVTLWQFLKERKST